MNDLIIPKPVMTATARHLNELKPFVDDGGKVTARDIDARTKLIPKDDCLMVIDELTAALQPCADDVSLVLANMLIGSYRVKDVVDPAIYINTIAEMFALFPADIGERIRKDIVGRVKWVPMPAEVKESGDQMIRERNAALYTARKHLEERERRRKYFEEKNKREAERGGQNDHLKGLYEENGVEWPGYDKASYADVAGKMTQPTGD